MSGFSKGIDSRAASRTEVRLFKFVRKRDLPSTAELERKWPLDFEAEAINISPEGGVCRRSREIARYQLDGTLLAQEQAPQVAAEPTDPEELKRQAEEMIEGGKPPERNKSSSSNKHKKKRKKRNWSQGRRRKRRRRARRHPRNRYAFVNQAPPPFCNRYAANRCPRSTTSSRTSRSG